MRPDIPDQIEIEAVDTEKKDFDDPSAMQHIRKATPVLGQKIDMVIGIERKKYV
ncbi:MAG TPA: hypothetical protein VN371_08130 [Chlorobaculum sp.]|nr:hypothetical protein [Chlorobaculum sp.]